MTAVPRTSPNAPFLFHLESPAGRLGIHKGQLHIRGWHLGRDLTEAVQIRVRIGRRVIPCKREPRPDVLEHLGLDPSLPVEPGFLCSLSSKKAGIKYVRIEAKQTLNSAWTTLQSRLLCLLPGLEDNDDGGVSILKNWAFTTLPAAAPLRQTPADPAALRIAWIIPDFDKGAGGHGAIFKVAESLKKAGHHNAFWVLWGSKHSDPSGYIDRHFSGVGAPVHALATANLDSVDADVVIATNCWSAYFANAIGKTWRKLYFVQDYEPWFYPRGLEYHYACNTYGFALEKIVSSRWLAFMMAEEHGASSVQFDYTFDPEFYHPPAEGRPQNPARIEIAFYGRISTDRRMVALGLQALDLLARRRNDFRVHFFGQQLGASRFAYDCEDHGVLGPRGLGDLYRRCHVGMVFSATNRSIVPTEMMACGLPVVELDGENNTRTYPEGSLLLTPPSAEKVADTLARLLDSADLRDRVSRAALDYAGGLSWEKTSAFLVAAITRKPE